VAGRKNSVFKAKQLPFFSFFFSVWKALLSEASLSPTGKQDMVRRRTRDPSAGQQWHKDSNPGLLNSSSAFSAPSVTYFLGLKYV